MNIYICYKFCREKQWRTEMRIVMPQFDWLCDVCGCVMSPTSGIYWVELGFINNYKELQLWLVILRYSADVASAFPWVITRMISTSCLSKSLEDRTSLMTHHVLNLLLNFILSCCILFTMYTLFILLLLLVCFIVIVF